MIKLIAAVTPNFGIGFQGNLLYRFRDDLQNFKNLTSNYPVIMGRTTYEEIGKPLPNRTNIVLTSQKDISIDGVTVSNNLEQALEKAKEVSETVWIIGGGKVYQNTIDIADEVYLTVIVSLSGELPDCDTFFPSIHGFDKHSIEDSKIVERCGELFILNFLKFEK